MHFPMIWRRIASPYMPPRRLEGGVSPRLALKTMIMIVVTFLIMMLVLSMIIAAGPWLVLVVGSVIHLVSGSLIARSSSSFHFVLLDSYC
jgi:hypothetical protein